jgi:hypothetical protein
MAFPTFVIIGAPKCGTSSVYQWLVDHPAACGAREKEVFYLLDAGHPLNAARPDYHAGGLAGYEALFEGCGGAPVVVEGSTQYLYAQTARDVLAALPTRPLVLALLREPARRLYSMFRYVRDTNERLDPRVTFHAYVAALRRGDTAFLERACFTQVALHEMARGIEWGRYAHWLAPWYEVLGRDRVMAAVFEDVIADPRAHMRGLAARLGIDPAFYDDYRFTSYNVSVGLRAPRLHWLVHRTPDALRSAPGLGLLRKAYRSLIIDRKARPSRRDRAAITELAASYAADNQHLADLTGLDLSRWRRRG